MEFYKKKVGNHRVIHWTSCTAGSLRRGSNFGTVW